MPVEEQKEIIKRLDVIISILLGNMLNVSVSGRVGIVIGYNDKTFRSFLRQLEYLAYTIEAKKLKFNSKNIIVLKPDQFENTIIKNIERVRSRR